MASWLARSRVCCSRLIVSIAAAICPPAIFALVLQRKRVWNCAVQPQRADHPPAHGQRHDHDRAHARIDHANFRIVVRIRHVQRLAGFDHLPDPMFANAKAGALDDFRREAGSRPDGDFFALLIGERDPRASAFIDVL